MNDDAAQDVLFEKHPDPMWIYHRSSLRILAVNSAALRRLGYSREEFLDMTIADLRATGAVAAATDSLDEMGVHQLIAKSGELFFAGIRAQSIDWCGAQAKLVCARDVTGLVEMEASLRTAKRLLDLGTWKMEVETGRIEWSDNLYEIHGVPRTEFGHRFEDYVALGHPADREAMLSEFEAFRRSGATQFKFHHRIVRSDGRVIHVRGLGELTAGPRGAVINGVSQDVTAEVEIGTRLAAATDLLRIAGRIGKIGGWRVVLGEDEVEWSEETARIHDLPGPRRLPIEEAIGFYPPNERERIRGVFMECAASGKPWDEVLRIVTATGRHAWVRAIGEAGRAPDGSIVAVHGAFQDISEIVATQQQAEDLARRLHETLNSMSDAFFTLDREWRFSFLNDHALLLLGRDRAALMDRNIWEEFPEAVGSSFQTQYETAARERRTVRFAEFYPPLDKWFQVTVYPMPEGLAVYFRDITQERADQAQLRLLETAVSRQGDMLVITEAEPIDRPDGPRIVYVNDAFVRITGYGRDEAIGKTPRILQGPATQPGELRRIRDALAAGKPVRAEVLNYSKAGQELWLELDIVPIADDSGRLTHWVAVQRDVTERHRAEEAMRVSEERFRLIARATNDVVWDWDLLAGRIWWNDTMRSLFGYEIDQLAPGPESWISKIHVEDADRVLAGIYAVIDGEGTAWEDEYRFLRADGTAAVVADRGFVIRAPDGKAIRMLGSMQDITERRRLDERLRESQKLEALGRLTGGIAHDFNNLLTVILGNAEVLTDRLSGQSDLHALADMIAAAAERGADLTDRLLAFARRQALEPVTVDVRMLITGMGGLLRRAVPESIDLQFVQCAEACLADIDRSLFESALLNLVINARDAMPEGGSLTIEAAYIDLGDAEAASAGGLPAGPYVRVSVTDTGSGMTPEVVARAFDPFFTTKDVGKGSGLGLSMVYGFVNQSGGAARILSERGHGTTVELYLPPSRTVAIGDDAPPMAESAAGGTEHILVVEDDDLVRRQALALLGTLGYRVTAVEGGPQALEALAGSKVDLLFTDVMMPGMNGPQLMDAALKLRPGLKVLFTSGFADDVLMRDGPLEPGVHLLRKPYRRQNLALKIRQVLDE